jgi:hypothetical protein
MRIVSRMTNPFPAPPMPSPAKSKSFSVSQSSASTQLRRLWILGFVGHRTLAAPAPISHSIRRAIEDFRKQVDGDMIGRASAAAGADLLFLEACRDVGLPYSVVLPFPEERFREDFDTAAEWSHVSSLINSAVSVEIAPGHEGAPEAYHLASREILDVADAMLFVWDGKPARGIGGTGETVIDARDRCVPHQIIDATNGMAGPFGTNRPFPWSDSDFTRLPNEGDMGALFEALDRRALQGAPKSRLLAAGSITLNQVATLVSAILIAFVGSEKAGPAVKFIIVCVAALLPWIGSRRRLRENWMEDRLHAELLRSLLASHSFSAPLQPFALDLFQSDAAFLRSAAWRLATRDRPWDEERNRYIRERLNGQIDYLDAKGNVAARRSSHLQTAFKISSVSAMMLGASAIFNAILKANNDWSVPAWLDSILFDFLLTILPALAAWSLSMIALFEYKRRAGLYLQMSGRLRRKRTELSGAKCRVTAANVISSCERLLLTELWEWCDSSGKRR